MARIYVPKNISESGTLLVHEDAIEIDKKVVEARTRKDEFVTVTIDNGFENGRKLKLKHSLIQAFE